MKKGQKLWTREELILAINLYWKLPFGKMHARTPEIIRLADLIERTPASVGRKLGNFASFDPSLQERGVTGLTNTSKLDREIWNEFFQNFDTLSYESELLLAKYEGKSIEQIEDIDFQFLPDEGIVREQLIKARVNQHFFRRAILASYRNTCCITGINVPSLLVAGHIIPWSTDEKNRMNPRNGLCLNSLHDRAYELGLISIDPDYKIHVSSKALRTLNRESFEMYFSKYHLQQIKLPSRYLPDPELLNCHFKNIFKNI